MPCVNINDVLEYIRDNPGQDIESICGVFGLSMSKFDRVSSKQKISNKIYRLICDGYVVAKGKPRVFYTVEK